MSEILQVALQKFLGQNVPVGYLTDQELVTLQRFLQKKLDVITADRQRRADELNNGCPI